jgi:hypothetical protein
MPLQIPNLDNRNYQQLLDAALARIPVHTPEWTNFNRSDPGVTLIEVFAFLTESLLYRANQIPERNRRKFLSLLGVPLQAASPARAIVTFANNAPGFRTITLNRDLEVRAGAVPFRTEQGLDVLPIEAPVYYKRKLDPVADPQLEQKRKYYGDLYASYLNRRDAATLAELEFFETTLLDLRAGEAGGLDLSNTVDGSLWIPLLVRPSDKPYDEKMIAEARKELAGKTLSLGIVPRLRDAQRDLRPGQQASAETQALLQFYLPAVPAGGSLPSDRVPAYRLLQSTATADVLTEPGVVQITLPSEDRLTVWNDLDPLEAGVADLPPALDDTNREVRLITWLRVRAAPGAQIGVLWVGANAAMLTQRARVSAELVGEGTGEPDQALALARSPVLPGSVTLTITPPAGEPEMWKEIDDLLSAGPEVPAPDLRWPPGRPPAVPRPNQVFVLDAEAGRIRFGDGQRGKRPPLGAVVRADYAYSVGQAGNVGPGSISSGAALPDGIKVTNPVRAWGGADAETVGEGEKQITRYLQHRDRLVTTDDFETITQRTPGVDIGRVEVLPASRPGNQGAVYDEAGAVTLLLIPSNDPVSPDAPSPDGAFLNAICAYLDQRRLVTTQVYLRGPTYRPLWVSIGITVQGGFSIAETRVRVRQAVISFLSPFTWRLKKSVIDRELVAVVSRVEGVLQVNDVLLALDTGQPDKEIPMSGLQLPRVVGLSVEIGDPLALDRIRGELPLDTSGAAAKVHLSVPVIPESCR